LSQFKVYFIIIRANTQLNLIIVFRYIWYAILKV